VGKNPTDRGKIGTKRSVLTDGSGVPIGLAVAGANRNDFKLTRETIESIAVARPDPTADAPQGMCLDKGYDYDEVRDILTEFGFTAHILARGAEAKVLKQEAGFKARRWVVERTHSWMNRFRRVLIRWDKKVRNYLALQRHLQDMSFYLKGLLVRKKLLPFITYARKAVILHVRIWSTHESDVVGLVCTMCGEILFNESLNLQRHLI
jgi:transposase